VPVPRLETPIGAIDGVNRVFTVSEAYTPGSTNVFLNGQLKRADFGDGWAELSPAAGTVELAEAPLVGDVVQVYFLDTTSPGVETQIEELEGVLVDEVSLSATL
jgi:hypothetical protein